MISIQISNWVYSIVTAAHDKIEAADQRQYRVYNENLCFTAIRKAIDAWMKDQEEIN